MYDHQDAASTDYYIKGCAVRRTPFRTGPKDPVGEALKAASEWSRRLQLLPGAVPDPIAEVSTRESSRCASGSRKSRRKNRDTSKIDFPCLNGLKYFQNRDNIHLSCFFSSLDALVSSWFKQTPGEKPLLIATVVRSTTVKYHNGFDKISRFKAIRQESSFNLSITNAEPLDSATYYCAVSYYSELALSDCAVVVLNGSSSSLYSVLQTPVLDSVEVGNNTTLQCSVLTDVSAGEHSVYWLRHGSGESPSGIIYTHGDTNSRCSRSSETDSPTQSCVYKLPKTNLSLSDAGTYYCAVAVCGQILFGNGTKLDFVGKASCDEALNYAALSFTNKPASSRGARRQQKLTDTEVYSQIKLNK
ncbi:uncharacterized protein [Hoplias malabaricus]|uniref:uncharacterized protein n=1 Tax=Hoplias malabaricus TaxID=27720 RepID=UPI003461EB77